MTGLKHLFRKKRRSHLPTRSTSTCSTTHAPSPEDQAYDPPPYYATNPQPAENGDARPLPRETLSQGLLDPNLNFTAAHMEAQWRAKDKIFAKAVVQFIAERFDGNLKGWAGYKYTYINEDENPPQKESSWDDLLGYNAYSYRGRFREISALAKRDFERRGFEVRKCEIYTSQDGIYVQWSLNLKKSSKSRETVGSITRV